VRLSTGAATVVAFSGATLLRSPRGRSGDAEFARLSAGGKGIRTCSPTVVFELAGEAERPSRSAAESLLRTVSIPRQRNRHGNNTPAAGGGPRPAYLLVMRFNLRAVCAARSSPMADRVRSDASRNPAPSSGESSERLDSFGAIGDGELSILTLVRATPRPATTGEAGCLIRCHRDLGVEAMKVVSPGETWSGCGLAHSPA
jgi:hypothetical protein